VRRSSIVNTTQGEWKSHVVRYGNGDVLDILNLYTSYIHGALRGIKMGGWFLIPIPAILDKGQFLLIKIPVEVKIIPSSSPKEEFSMAKRCPLTYLCVVAVRLHDSHTSLWLVEALYGEFNIVTRMYLGGTRTCSRGCDLATNTMRYIIVCTGCLPSLSLSLYFSCL
jgi:hypothetical protein